MLKNYILITFRNAMKHKLFTSVNVIGLAIGYAAVILISLFVREQLSYDSFWSDSERIFRFHITYTPPGREPSRMASTNGLARDALIRDIPEIENAARMSPMMAAYKTISTQSESENVATRQFSEGIGMIDLEFLEIFNLNEVAGSIDAYRNDINSMIVSKSFAELRFGSVEASLDQTLTVSLGDIVKDFRVAAIVDDLPEQSHLRLPALIHFYDHGFASYDVHYRSWYNTNNFTYFKISEGVDPIVVDDKLVEMVDRNAPVTTSMGHTRASQLMSPSMMNIRDIQLHSVGIGEIKPTGDIVTVIAFSSVAFLILVIASLNFINLSTVRATQRTREVALRRMLGASRPNLIKQFLGESVIISLIALLFAFAMLEMFASFYSMFLGTAETFKLYSDPMFPLLSIFMAVIVGGASGIYPAFNMSWRRPANLLRGGQVTEPPAMAKTRSILVIVQFAITTALIVATALLFLQFDFMRNKSLGFEQENLVVLRNFDRPEARNSEQALINELIRIEGVENVARSTQVPSDTNNWNWDVSLEGGQQENKITFGMIHIDDAFLPTYGIEPLYGRNYSRDREGDKLPNDGSGLSRHEGASVIINETAVRALGIEGAEQAIGKVVMTPGPLTIIGVIPDVHFYSLKSDIRPEMYLYWEPQYQNLSLRLEQAASQGLIAEIEKVWNVHVIDIPFQHEFLSVLLSSQYGEQEKLSELLVIFCLLAVFISCMGLYGMATFTVERKTREIGIRKVFGATVRDIIKLVIWQLTKPVVLANVVAWPLALYFVWDWLLGFSYRIDFWSWAPPICLMATSLVLIICWATVGTQAYRVARSNPIHALRYE